MVSKRTKIAVVYAEREDVWSFGEVYVPLLKESTRGCSQGAVCWGSLSQGVVPRCLVNVPRGSSLNSVLLGNQ